MKFKLSLMELLKILQCRNNLKSKKNLISTLLYLIFKKNLCRSLNKIIYKIKKKIYKSMKCWNINYNKA